MTLSFIVTLTLLCVAIETKGELNLDDVTAVVGEKFDYQIGNEEFLSTYKIYRIVQRGQKKLPEWLTYDTNSSMLIGYPETTDVGMYTLKLRAQCIDPAVTFCQDKLSRTFHVTVVELVKSAESRGSQISYKHEKTRKWGVTNKQNGNRRLYVEYDVTQHGKTLEEMSESASSVLEAMSESISSVLEAMSESTISVLEALSESTISVLEALSESTISVLEAMSESSSSVLEALSESTSSVHVHLNVYSAIQHDDIDKYISNTGMHAMLSSSLYLENHEILFRSSDIYSTVQYATNINLVHNNDRREMLLSSSDIYSTVQYATNINLVHNNDGREMLLSSSDIYSTVQYATNINLVHNNDRREMLLSSSDIYSTMQYITNTHSIHTSDSHESMSASNVPHMTTPKSEKFTADNFCLDDIIVYCASLLLHVESNLTTAEEETITYKWSNFVSKHPNMVFIAKTESDVMNVRSSGKFILTAGPGNVIKSLSESVELSWHLACGFFEQVHDFTRILQHNIDVGRVTQEIKFNVIAWFVYTNRPQPKRVKRQAHMAGRQTGTPTISPPLPTTISVLSTKLTESSISSFPITLMSSTVSTSFPPVPSTSLSLFTFVSTGMLSFSSGTFNDTRSVGSSTTLPFTLSPSVTEYSIFSSSLRPSSPLIVISSVTLSFSVSVNASTISVFYPVSTVSLSHSLLPSFSTPSDLSLHSTFSSVSITQSVFSSLPVSESISLSVDVSSTVVLSSSLYSHFQILSSSSTVLTGIASTNTSTLPSIEYSSPVSASEIIYSVTSTHHLKVATSSFSSSTSTEILSTTPYFFKSDIVTTSPILPPPQTSTPLSSQESSTFTVSSLTSSVKQISSSRHSATDISSVMYKSETSKSSISSSPLITSTTDISQFSSDLPTQQFRLSSNLTSIPSSAFPSITSSSHTIRTFHLSSSRLTATADMFSISSLHFTKSLIISDLQSSSSMFSLLFSSSLYQASLHTSTIAVLSSSTLDITTHYFTSAISITSTPSIPSYSSSVSLSTSFTGQLSPTSTSTYLSTQTKTPYTPSLLNSSSLEFLPKSFSESLFTVGSSVITVASSKMPLFSSLSPSSTSVILESSTFEATPSLSNVSSVTSTSFVSSVSAVSTLPLSEDASSTVVPSISPSRASASLTSVESSTIVTTAAPDDSPFLNRSIDHLEIIIGRFYQLQIPDNTFSDKEDGNTRNLNLTINLTYGKPLPIDSWLMFNATSQTLYGIPLKSDSEGGSAINEFTLTAMDSQGQVAKDAISLTYKHEPDINHRISIVLNDSYETFVDDRRNLIQVARNIARFYEDQNLNFLTFSGIEKGSVVIVWSNRSLIGTDCLRNEIQELYDRISDVNETISDTFLASFPNFMPVSTSLEFFGACLVPQTTFAPPTKSTVSETNNKMWIEIVLPALIAILFIVIIALLLLICCRHRRPSKNIKDSDKPAFLEDRRPIIFPDELEMVDPSLRPKTPLVLPSDYLQETAPAVPPHGRPVPPYRTPMLDDDALLLDDEDAPQAPPHGGHMQQTEPPPYRLPPPYYNPHRMA